MDRDLTVPQRRSARRRRGTDGKKRAFAAPGRGTATQRLAVLPEQQMGGLNAANLATKRLDQRTRFRVERIVVTGFRDQTESAQNPKGVRIWREQRSHPREQDDLLRSRKSDAREFAKGPDSSRRRAGCEGAEVPAQLVHGNPAALLEFLGEGGCQDARLGDFL